MREKIEQIDKCSLKYRCRECGKNIKLWYYSIFSNRYSYETSVCEACDFVEIFKYPNGADLDDAIVQHRITGKDKRRIAKTFPEIRDILLCEK